MSTEKDEQRIKRVKHHLIDIGKSFRGWCMEKNISHSVARDLVYGRLTGNKSDKIRYVRDVLVEEFGEDLFT
jgi:hypothetical protein